MLITFGNVLARYFTSPVLRRDRGVLDRAADRAVLPRFLGRLRLRSPHPRRFLRPQAAAGLACVRSTGCRSRSPASLFAFIAFYAGKLTWDQYRFEETSPALGVPQWWYTGVDAGAGAAALVLGALAWQWQVRVAGMIGSVLSSFLLALLGMLLPAPGFSQHRCVCDGGFDQLGAD